jgi:hypothetical protein
MASVLDEEMLPKHPIHVYDINSRKDDKDKDNSFEDPSSHKYSCRSQNDNERRVTQWPWLLISWLECWILVYYRSREPA